MATGKIEQGAIYHLKSSTKLNVYENDNSYIVQGMIAYDSQSKKHINSSWTTVENLGISIARAEMFMVYSYNLTTTFYGRITTDGKFELVPTSGNAVDVLQLYLCGAVYCEKA